MELPDPTDVKESLKITVNNNEVKRAVVAVSNGCHFVGGARPRIDPNDPLTKVAGAMKRVGRQPPRRHKLALTKVDRFCRKWLKKNLVPLPPDTDLSFETFIQNTPYPLSRKVELQGVNFENTDDPCSKDSAIVKGFIKDESYAEYKHARWINSRSDIFKCHYGPWIKAIESEVYKHPAFIKHIPVSERADYILELLGEDGPYYETDYTAYETHFIGQVMRVLEFNLFHYMTQYVPGHSDFMRMNFKVVGGNNQIFSSNMKFSVQARMSGEMSTSLGNGFSNLMIMLLVAKLKGCSDVKGVVEGDDGLFTLKGAAPEQADFAELGFMIKLDKYTHINDCSFCGIVFDDLDKLVVTDPVKVIMNFGWASAQYTHCSDKKLQALLRAKSMSFLAAYPGCPVVQSLALYGIRVTNHISAKYLRKTVAKMKVSVYEREKMFQDMHPKPKPVGMRTRNLIADRYHITVEQQYAIETHFDRLNYICPISVEIPISDHCADYWDNYVLLHPHVEGMFNVPITTDLFDRLQKLRSFEVVA